MINKEKLELLRLRADRQGALRTDDLREVLPVDEMSADELALVVLELEETGIAIDIDEALVGSSRRRNATSQETSIINLPGARSGVRDVASTRLSKPDHAPDALTPLEPVERATTSHSGAWKFVAAAAIVIAIGASAAFLLFR